MKLQSVPATWQAGYGGRYARRPYATILGAKINTTVTGARAVTRYGPQGLSDHPIGDHTPTQSI